MTAQHNLEKAREVLFKPFKRRFLILFFLFLFSAYFFTGFGIINRPSLILRNSRGWGLEMEAVTFLKSQRIHCADPPRVYVLTKDIRKIFNWPYKFAFKLMMDMHYADQVNQSYSGIEDNAIVMQEEEAYNRWLLAHEVGHMAQFCSNPDEFLQQTTTQKEKFAEKFRDSVQLKFQSKTHPYQ